VIKTIAGKPRIIKANELIYGYTMERQVMIIVNAIQV
jgi:hypothetical protein